MLIIWVGCIIKNCFLKVASSVYSCRWSCEQEKKLLRKIAWVLGYLIINSRKILRYVLDMLFTIAVLMISWTWLCNLIYLNKLLEVSYFNSRLLEEKYLWWESWLDSKGQNCKGNILPLEVLDYQKWKNNCLGIWLSLNWSQYFIFLKFYLKSFIWFQVWSNSEMINKAKWKDSNLAHHKYRLEEVSNWYFFFFFFFKKCQHITFFWHSLWKGQLDESNIKSRVNWHLFNWFFLSSRKQEYGSFYGFFPFVFLNHMSYLSLFEPALWSLEVVKKYCMVVRFTVSSWLDLILNFYKNKNFLYQTFFINLSQSTAGLGKNKSLLDSLITLQEYLYSSSISKFILWGKSTMNTFFTTILSSISVLTHFLSSSSLYYTAFFSSVGISFYMHGLLVVFSFISLIICFESSFFKKQLDLFRVRVPLFSVFCLGYLSVISYCGSIGNSIIFVNIQAYLIFMGICFFMLYVHENLYKTKWRQKRAFIKIYYQYISYLQIRKKYRWTFSRFKYINDILFFSKNYVLCVLSKEEDRVWNILKKAKLNIQSLVKKKNLNKNDFNYSFSLVSVGRKVEVNCLKDSFLNKRVLVFPSHQLWAFSSSWSQDQKVFDYLFLAYYFNEYRYSTGLVVCEMGSRFLSGGVLIKHKIESWVYSQDLRGVLFDCSFRSSYSWKTRDYVEEKAKTFFSYKFDRMPIVKLADYREQSVGSRLVSSWESSFKELYLKKNGSLEVSREMDSVRFHLLDKPGWIFISKSFGWRGYTLKDLMKVWIKYIAQNKNDNEVGFHYSFPFSYRQLGLANTFFSKIQTSMVLDFCQYCSQNKEVSTYLFSDSLYGSHWSTLEFNNLLHLRRFSQVLYSEDRSGVNKNSEIFDLALFKNEFLCGLYILKSLGSTLFFITIRNIWSSLIRQKKA